MSNEKTPFNPDIASRFESFEFSLIVAGMPSTDAQARRSAVENQFYAQTADCDQYEINSKAPALLDSLMHAVWGSLEFHDVHEFRTEKGELISRCWQCRYGTGHLAAGFNIRPSDGRILYTRGHQFAEGKELIVVRHVKVSAGLPPLPISPEEVAKIDRAIRIGVRKVLPSKVLSKVYTGISYSGRATFAQTQIADDIRQKVFVRLLDTNTLKVGDTVNTKAAYNLARRYSTDWLRKEMPVMPTSQMDLLHADPEDEESEVIEPQDRVDPSDFYRANLDAGTLQILGWELDDSKIRALDLLRTEKPEDHQFIITYAIGLRKGQRYSLKDRHKALTIRRWMRRRLN
jgi:hypothetical protein